jgi:hypothetical protein
LRIGRLDLDGTLVVLVVHRHHLLRSAVQPAVCPGPRAHILHRVHHIGLLGQERIPQIGGPLDIVGQ